MSQSNASSSSHVTHPPSLVAPIPNSYVVAGRHLFAGEYPGARNEQDARTTLTALLDAGIGVFVDLTAPEDGLRPYESTLRALAKGKTVERLHAPVPDVSITDDTRMGRILDYIDSALETGQGVYVHCWGGVGRTGTVIGCWLVRHGHSGNDALAEVSRLFASTHKAGQQPHRRSPETSEQCEMIRRWRGVEDERNRLGTRLFRASAAEVEASNEGLNEIVGD